MAKKKVSLKVRSLAELRKKYPGSNVASIVIPSAEDMLWLPSDILALNHWLGGGIPYGKIMEVFGEESTGKSLLAMNFARAAQSLGGIVLWADAENAWTRKWAELNGLDNDKVELYKGPDVEGISDWIQDMIVYYRSILVNNEPILFVVDSLATLECRDNMGESQIDKKAEMGNRAKAIGTLWRLRNPIFDKYGICVIAINQIRRKVGAGMFEDPDTTTGGAATKFYASQRINIRRGKQIKFKIKGKEKKVGQNVFFQSKKNKVAPPSDSLEGQVYFREENELGYVGYSKYVDLAGVLVEEGILKKKGSRYYFKDKEVANGEEKLNRKLAEDDELRAKLVKRSSINTISKTRKKLESLSDNLYPVKLKSSDDDEE